MPDLNPDGTVNLPATYAIAACHLCNGDGYRGTHPCDHVDHTPAAVRGRELVRAELERIRERKSNPSAPCDPPASTETHQNGSGDHPAADRLEKHAQEGIR